MSISGGFLHQRTYALKSPVKTCSYSSRCRWTICCIPLFIQNFIPTIALLCISRHAEITTAVLNFLLVELLSSNCNINLKIWRHFLFKHNKKEDRQRRLGFHRRCTQKKHKKTKKNKKKQQHKNKQTNKQTKKKKTTTLFHKKRKSQSTAHLNKYESCNSKQARQTVHLHY